MTIQAHNIQTLVGLHREVVHYNKVLQMASTYTELKSLAESLENAEQRFYSFAVNLIESEK